MNNVSLNARNLQEYLSSGKIKGFLTKIGALCGKYIFATYRRRKATKSKVMTSTSIYWQFQHVKTLQYFIQPYKRLWSTQSTNDKWQFYHSLQLLWVLFVATLCKYSKLYGMLEMKCFFCKAQPNFVARYFHCQNLSIHMLITKTPFENSIVWQNKPLGQK